MNAVNPVFAGTLAAMSGAALRRALRDRKPTDAGALACEKRMAQPATDPAYVFMEDQRKAERELAQAMRAQIQAHPEQWL